MKLQSKILRFLAYAFATCGGLGYVPYAPGTVTSFVAAIVFFMLQDFSRLLLGLTVLMFFGGVLIAGFIAQDLKKTDPSIVVIDEWVGMWAAFSMMHFVMRYDSLRSAWFQLIVLFIYFRFFDIKKPWAIQRAEKISGGWGIMLDDLIAALYAFIAVIVTTGVLFVGTLITDEFGLTSIIRDL